MRLICSAFQQEKMHVIPLHEVGHTLGLLDQRFIVGYTKILNLRIIEHPSSAGVNYAGEVIKGSVMDALSSPLHVKGVAPDDADALILAIDLCLHNYNRGGKTGWKSLHPKSELYYVHGKIGNSPHSFTLIEDDKESLPMESVEIEERECDGDPVLENEEEEIQLLVQGHKTS